MHRPFLFVLFAAFCFGCTSSFQLPGTKTKVAMADDLRITLNRSQCYGTCPQYELSIDADGTVTFDGKKHTKVIGPATQQIDRAAIERLVKEFDGLGYLDLRDAYDQDTCPSYATDMSTVSTSIRLNGRTKRVSHYLGCSEKGPVNKPYPPGLRELEDQIDAVAGSAQWIRDR